MSFHGDLLGLYQDLPGWGEAVVRAFLYAAAAWAILRVLRILLLGAAARAGVLDATLRSFLRGILAAVTWVLVAVAFLAGLGVDPAPLFGTLAVGGFILGFALKDTLGNLAAGVMLLVYRPFLVGEAVELSGQGGVVTDLGMAMTRLRTWDGRLVTIPNGTILNTPILNYSRNPTRRVEVDTGIGFDDSLDAATRALLEMARGDPRVLDDPAPQVVVQGLGEDRVNLQLRAWVPTSAWGDAKSDLTKGAKVAIEGAGCKIPYPRRDLRVEQPKGQG